MKILEIRIKNLNSLKGEWIINLKDAYKDGIFAIIGPTGSGKSTILDAITLALYGRTPRFENISKSTNEIMNKDSSECSSEVLFEVNNILYRSSFKQHRARGILGGALQGAKRDISLEETHESLMQTKSNAECDKILADLINIDYKQFMLSVMLSQGEFSKFIKASDNEKSDILEKLTRTDIYAKISAKVFDKKTFLEKELNEIKIKILENQNNSFSENKLLKYQISQKKSLEKTNRFQTNISKISSYLDSYKNKESLTQEINKLENEFLNLRESFYYYKKNISKIEISDLFNKYLEDLKEFNSKKDNYLKTKNKEITDKNSITTLENNLINLKKDKEIKEKDIKNLEGIISHLTFLNSNYEKISNSNFRLENLAEINLKLQSLGANFKEAPIEASKFYTFNNLYEKISRNLKEFQSTNDKLELIIASGQSIRKQIDLLNKELEEESTFQESLKIIKIQKEEISKRIIAEKPLEKIISLLKEGDNCPICQNTIKILNTNLDEDLSKLKEDERNKDKEIYEINLKLDSFKVIKNRLESLKEKRINLSCEYKNTKDDEETLLLDLFRNIKDIETPSKLNFTFLESFALINSKNSEDISLDKSSLKEDLLNLYTLTQEESNSYNKFIKDLNDIYQINSKYSEILNEYDRKLNYFIDSLSDIKSLEIDNTYKDLFLENFYEYIKDITPENLKKTSLTECLNEFHKTLEYILEDGIKFGLEFSSSKELRSILIDCSKALNLLQQKVLSSNENIFKSKSKIESLKESIKDNNLDKKLQEFENIGLNIHEFLDLSNSIEKEKISLSNTSLTNNSQSFLNKYLGFYSQINEELSSIEAPPKIESNLEIKLTYNSQVFKDILYRYILSEAEKSTLNQDYSDYKINKSSLDKQIKSLKEKLDFEEKSIKSQDINLDSIIGLKSNISLNSLDFNTKVFLINSLKNRYERLRDKHINYQGRIKAKLDGYLIISKKIIELEENYKILNKAYIDYKKLSDLIGSRDGNKFKKYAQSLSFDFVLKFANEELKEIYPRYILRRTSDENLDLSVIDTNSGGTIRSVKSLSGGESFLISMALSLGLSKMGDNSQIDCFFLDEGFGSLDENTVEIALSALNKLKENGKLIGLITHVKLIQESINNKITLSTKGGLSYINGPWVKQIL
ncbi:MAG: AAA family ATPase [Psittacicella sp.]